VACLRRDRTHDTRLTRRLTETTARGFYRSKKGAEDGLHRLAMQGKTVSGRLLHPTLFGPSRLVKTRLLVQVHTRVPDLGRFRLRRFEATEENWRKMSELIHANGLLR
jgi:hypothetical protein